MSPTDPDRFTLAELAAIGAVLDASKLAPNTLRKVDRLLDAARRTTEAASTEQEDPA